MGSHGFLLSPHAREAFFRALATRNMRSSLIIPNVRTTQWSMRFVHQGVVEERMWTQEMIALAYHHKMTTLYPPHTTPFAEHCATDHGVDEVHATASSSAGRATCAGSLFSQCAGVGSVPCACALVECLVLGPLPHVTRAALKGLPRPGGPKFEAIAVLQSASSARATVASQSSVSLQFGTGTHVRCAVCEHRRA